VKENAGFERVARVEREGGRVKDWCFLRVFSVQGRQTEVGGKGLAVF
jgi:hypothetical protein